MRKVLVIHGPNLNLLGEREPEIYGTLTLPELNQVLEDLAQENNLKLHCFQSNHEGAIIDFIHANRKVADAILINPAAYTHTSVALRDAIFAVKIPTIEVHLSDIMKREDFRKVSLIRGVCIGHFMGEGVNSYKKGLLQIASYFKDQERK